MSHAGSVSTTARRRPCSARPSVDCPPAPGANISGGGLDILFNPSTTGSIVKLPGLACDAADGISTTRKCIFGAEIGKTCGADSDCSGGGVGSCVNRCFCPSGGGTPQKPSDCFAACRGGTNDYGSCGADSDCPGGGLCETQSCRIAAGVLHRRRVRRHGVQRRLRLRHRRPVRR